MKKYIAPSLEAYKYETADIITLSFGGENGDGDSKSLADMLNGNE